VRRGLLRVLSRFGPAGNDPPPRLERGTRVLLVQASFRLGHNVLATAAVDAITAAVGGEAVGLLAGPTAPALTAGFGLHRVHVLRRADLVRPLRLLALLRAIRRERYGVAVHLGGSGASLGALLTGLSGATHRIGRRGRHGNLFFTSAVPPARRPHKLEELAELVRALGVDRTPYPRVPLSPAERATARRWLRSELATGTAVAVFPCGRARKGKPWDVESLAGVTRRLRSMGVSVVVFLGPEERPRRERIRRRLGPGLYVEESDLRNVAILCSACSAAVAPDSGPMHLAVAVGTPTVALFRKGNHHRWGPPAPHTIVVDPAGLDVEGVLVALGELLRRSEASHASPGRSTSLPETG